MKDKTFADYLIRHGAKLPADTVCFKLDDRISIKDDYELFNHSFPVFSNICLEYRDIIIYATTTKMKRKTPTQLVWFDKNETIFDPYDAIKYELENKIAMSSTMANIVWYDCDIKPRLYVYTGTSHECTYATFHIYNTDEYLVFSTLLQEQLGGLLSPSLVEEDDGSLTAYFSNLHSVEDDNGTEKAVLIFLTAMGLLHQKIECELITHSRGVRRNIKRKTGKEPSPYFMLKIDPTKPNKRYKPSGRKTGIKKSQHIVRGFFRHTINHPIQQFNGTFWIPSHMRGDKAQGETLKGYTIVLPNED